MSKKFQDILMGTEKTGFYDNKGDTQGLSSLHKEAMNEDRELYTYLLHLKTNLYLPKSLIMENLLSNSLHNIEGASNKDIEIENHLIHKNLESMGITHALKTLLQVTESANNARTTRIALGYLLNLEQLDKVLIKYKTKATKLLKKVLGAGTCYNSAKEGVNSKSFKRLKKYLNNTKWDDLFILEMMNFLFSKDEFEYSNIHLLTYRRIQKVFQEGSVKTEGDLLELLDSIPEHVELPIEVMEGFLSKTIHLRHLLYKSNNVNLSNKQQVQMEKKIQEIEKESGVVIERTEVDYNKLTTFDILRANYNEDASPEFISNINNLGSSLKDVDAEEESSILTVINKKTYEIAEELKDSPILENSSILIDLSGSMNGSSETLRHPLLKSLEIAGALMATGRVEKKMYSGGSVDANGMLIPKGASDIASKILELIEDGQRNILIVSDGFSNRYDVAETVEAIQGVIGDSFSITHINPTFSGRKKEVKEIAGNIATIGVNSSKDLVQLEKLFLLQMNPELFKVIVLNEILKEMEEM